MKRIYITESQARKLSETTSYTKDGSIILYRVGGIADEGFNSKFGLFFTDDLGYYGSWEQCTGLNAKDAEKYLLSPNAKIWDPVTELNLGVNNWDYIKGKMEDFEKYDIKDECGWEMPEDMGSTSTDGLAIAGRKLGYDGVLIKGTAYIDNGNYANEYVIYNPQVIRKI